MVKVWDLQGTQSVFSRQLRVDFWRQCWSGTPDTRERSSFCSINYILFHIIYTIMDVKSDTSSLSCSSSSSSSSLSPLSSSYSHCAYCGKRFSALQKRINCSENNRILINEIGIPHPYRNSKLIHTKCEVAIRLNLLQGQSPNLFTHLPLTILLIYVVVLPHQ